MAIVLSKFRSPGNKQLYTQQLFYEMAIDMPAERRNIEPMYSLHTDVPGLPNFRKEYVKDMDTTGYKTSTRLLESFAHFQVLLRSKWFQEAKTEWDKEIAAKMEQEATDKLRGILNAPEGDLKPSERISAAKALLTRAKDVKALSEPQKGNKRGRPSKDEVEGALKEEVRLSKEEQEDLERINVVHITRGK